MRNSSSGGAYVTCVAAAMAARSMCCRAGTAASGAARLQVRPTSVQSRTCGVIPRITGAAVHRHEVRAPARDGCNPALFSFSCYVSNTFVTRIWHEGAFLQSELVVVLMMSAHVPAPLVMAMSSSASRLNRERQDGGGYATPAPVLTGTSRLARLSVSGSCTSSASIRPTYTGSARSVPRRHVISPIRASGHCAQSQRGADSAQTAARSYI